MEEIMQILLLLMAITVSVGTILYGNKAYKEKKKGNIKTYVAASVSAFGFIALTMIISAMFGKTAYAEVEEVAASAGLSLGDGFKYLAAAISTGLGTIGAGIAVASVGSAAIGAVTEDSSILGKTLIFVGMAEGISIFGMIISILILFS
jgi:V/A-type H+-transporting ATPase subunit K